MDTSNIWTTLDSGAINVALGTANGGISSLLSGQGTINTNIAALPTAAQNADAVWDESTTGHDNIGTFGQAAVLDNLTISANSALFPNLSNLDAAISSLPSAVNIRAEMDSQSVLLGNINSQMNVLAADWLDGGRLDNILDNASTVDAAAIRAEIDTNSTQLAAIVADTNEIQVSLADGGFTNNLIDSIKAETATILVDTNFTQVTLDSGGAIHTLVTNITPNPNTLSPEFIDKARTWKAPSEKDTARNHIVMLEGDVSVLAMDFSDILNSDTSVGTPLAWSVVEGDAADLTIGTPQVAQDHRGVHCKINGQLTGKTYKIKVSVITTDNDTISRHGKIKVG